VPNVELNTVVAMDTIGPFADGGYLGIIVGSDGTWFYATMFHATTLTNVTSGGQFPLTMGTWPSLTYDPEVADAALGYDHQTGNGIRFLFTDRVGPDPAFRWCSIGTSGTQISLDDNAASFESLILLGVINGTASALNKYPQRFAKYIQNTEQTVYILRDDGYLWRIELVFGAATENFFSLTSVLSDPLVIAIDAMGTSLTAGNAAGTTADLSSYIP